MIYTHLLHNFSTTCQRGNNIFFFFSTFVHATRNPKRGSFKFHNPRFQRCQTASPFELSNFSLYRSTRRSVTSAASLSAVVRRRSSGASARSLSLPLSGIFPLPARFQRCLVVPPSSEIYLRSVTSPASLSAVVRRPVLPLPLSLSPAYFRSPALPAPALPASAGSVVSSPFSLDGRPPLSSGVPLRQISSQSSSISGRPR
jgi:hypothetical protein